MLGLMGGKGCLTGGWCTLQCWGLRSWGGELRGNRLARCCPLAGWDGSGGNACGQGQEERKGVALQTSVGDPLNTLGNAYLKW